MPLAATIGVGVLGAGSTLIASSNNANAINNSTQASVAAQQQAIAAQSAAVDKQIAAQTAALNASLGQQAATYNSGGQMQTAVRNQNVGILNPFAQTGYSAMNTINDLIGLPEQKGYTPKPIAFTPITAQQVPTPTPTPALSASQYAPPTAAPGAPYPFTANGITNYIPSYAFGTPPGGHLGGLARIGDANRPERVNTPQGQTSVVSTPQVTNLPAGTTVTPDPQMQALNNFYQTPVFQFPVQQAIDAIQSNYAARGMEQSGAAQKAIADYVAGVAAPGAFGQYMGYLGNQQGLGFSAASAETGIGQGYANNITNMGTNYSNALTGLNTGYANGLSGAYGNLANAQGNYATNIGNINSNAAMMNANNTNSMIGGVGSSLGGALGYMAYNPSIWGGSSGVGPLGNYTQPVGAFGSGGANNFWG